MESSSSSASGVVGRGDDDGARRFLCISDAAGAARRFARSQVSPEGRVDAAEDAEEDGRADDAQHDEEDDERAPVQTTVVAVVVVFRSVPDRRRAQIMGAAEPVPPPGLLVRALALADE